MNSELEISLAAARWWRDRGNDLLILFLVVEFLLEVWPGHPSAWSPWNPKASLFFRLSWLSKRLPSKRRLTVIAAAMVVLGVAVERYKGNDADDLADRIRTNLQIKLIEVAPRVELLYGESRKHLVAALKKPEFKGQQIETRFCSISFSRAYIDEDTMNVAMRLPDVFSEAGWSADFPVRREGCNGTGIWVQLSPKASKHTRDAAALVVASLKALPMVANLTADLGPDEAPKDVNTVVITVEAHPL